MCGCLRHCLVYISPFQEACFVFAVQRGDVNDIFALRRAELIFEKSLCPSFFLLASVPALVFFPVPSGLVKEKRKKEKKKKSRIVPEKYSITITYAIAVERF